MRNKRPSALSGSVDIPILPVIVVIAILVIVVIAGKIHNTPFVVNGFQIAPDDVAGTTVVSLPDKHIDLTLHLTQPGADRLSAWANAHPNTALPVTFGGTYLGDIPLSANMDTSAIHMVVATDKATAVRYDLGR